MGDDVYGRTNERTFLQGGIPGLKYFEGQPLKLATDEHAILLINSDCWGGRYLVKMNFFIGFVVSLQLHSSAWQVTL